MGRLMKMIMQKFLPATKKSILIKFRKKNGAWTEFLLPPNKESFKMKGNETVYYIKGTPDIEDSTNQRCYNFISGIPYPIDLSSKHPEMLENFNKEGNLAMMLTEADQQGYDRAMLVKKKKVFDVAMWTLIAVGINLLISIGVAAMVAGLGA